MQVLAFGTYDTGRHPRVGIVIDGLRDLGCHVTALNEPLGFSTAERVAMLNHPWLADRVLLRLLRRWAVLARRSRQIRRQGPFDLILVGYLGHFDVVLARLLFRRLRVALDMLVFAADTARDRGLTSRWRLYLLGVLDRLASRCADLILLDTDAEMELLPVAIRPKAIVVSVGASRAWFHVGEGRSTRRSDQLHVVFFGLFTPLQGTLVLAQALSQIADRPDIEMTIVGTGQDHEAARAIVGDRKSTTWIDWLEPPDLIRLVASQDVCLGIFGTSPKALRVVPNKVYQGAAAGCAIVTSDTVPQRRVLADAAIYVPAGDSASLATVLRRLADEPQMVAEYRSRAHAAATERFTPAEIALPVRDRLVASKLGLPEEHSR